MNTQSRFTTKSTDAAGSSTSSTKPRTKRVPPQPEVHAAHTTSDTLFNLPTSRRVLVATLAGLLTYATSIYWSMAIVEWVAVGAVVMTGSGFLGFLVTVLAWFMAFVASLRLGYRVAKFVLAYEPSAYSEVAASIKDAAQRRVSLVRGWFKRSDDVAEPTFGRDFAV
jgi:hypothetical protein